MKIDERDSRAYFNDIVESCDRILGNAEHMTLDDFRADLNMQDVFARRFEIIGEAVKQIPSSVRDAYPDIAWRDAAGFRDVIAHDYVDIEIDQLYTTAVHDVPVLRAQIASVLADLQKES